MAEIKKAYRRLSLKHHPDKHGGDEVQFMRIAKAYAAWVRYFVFSIVFYVNA